MKKILSLLLSLMILLAFTPISAFAVGSQNVYFPSTILENGVSHGYEYNPNDKSMTYVPVPDDKVGDYDISTQYDTLFMLPSDINSRNIVLSEMVNPFTTELTYLLSDASASGKVNCFIDQYSKYSYSVSNGKLTTIQYANTNNKSFAKYVNGKLTNLTLRAPYMEDGEYVIPLNSSFNIKYKNGAISSLKREDRAIDDNIENDNYTVDKQGRVIQIKYLSEGQDIKKGVLIFTYDDSGKLIKITDSYHWGYNNTRTKTYNCTINLKYTNGQVSQINISDTNYGKHVITAQYQKL